MSFETAVLKTQVFIATHGQETYTEMSDILTNNIMGKEIIPTTRPDLNLQPPGYHLAA